MAEAALRWPLAAYCWTVSAYCLLLNVPLTWRVFIQARIYPRWLEGFLEWQLLIHAALLSIGLWTLPRGRKLPFGTAWLALGAALAPDGLSGLSPGNLSAALGCAVWLGPPAYEWGLWKRLPPSRAPSDAGLLRACLLWALACFAAFSAAALARFGAAEAAAALPWSLSAHLLLAVAAFALLGLLAPLGAPALAAAAALALYGFFESIAASLAGGGASQRAVSASAALGLAAALLGQWARPAGAGRARLWAAALALAGAAGALLPPRLDWRGSFQTAAAAACWLGTFLLVRTLPEPARPWRLAPTAAAALLLAAVWAQAWILTRLSPPGSPRAVSSALAGWQDREPSFRLCRKLLGIRLPEPGLHRFLRSRVRLPPETPVRPPPPIAEAGAPWPARPPDVYLIFIDSLRRDYLGAYNPKAAFTPRLDELAREGAAVPDAFTAYAGTGLSMASVWSGAFAPHLQFPKPFSDFNALEALARGAGYELYATDNMVPIEMLAPAAGWELYSRKTDGSLRLCSILKDLADRSERARKPLFSFILAEDVHSYSLERDRRLGARADGAYEGFDPAYARRVAEMDACLGRFIDGLRRRGRLDRSVVLVSSDHGEFLGEGGRMGHTEPAPEVARVPLILRLPPGSPAPRLDRAALLTDIAPTLYEVLGRRPRRSSPLQGLSLFSRERPGWRLLGSTYGPSFALVDDSGRSLYLADGDSGESFFYELGASSHEGPLPPSASLEGRLNAIIADSLAELWRLYGLPEPAAPQSL